MHSQHHYTWALLPANALECVDAERNWTQTATRTLNYAPLSQSTGKGCAGFQHCAPIDIKQNNCVNQPASIGVGKSTSSGQSLSSGLNTVWWGGITWAEGEQIFKFNVVSRSFLWICKRDTSSNEREPLRSAQSSSNSTLGWNVSYMDFVIRKVIPHCWDSTIESSWRQQQTFKEGSSHASLFLFGQKRTGAKLFGERACFFFLFRSWG